MYSYSNFISGTDRYGGFSKSDEFRIEGLAKKLNYPVEDILRAIQEVGFDKDDVEEYIRDRYNRC